MSEAIASEDLKSRKKTGAGSGAQVETFKYDNRIVRAFAIATVVWGLVGMAAGLLIATELFWPGVNLNLQFITFGRLRSLHTNAVIFAFVGNGMFMGSGSARRACSATS
jgi:cbb3-type cytochrome oxidase subunit 1